ncbi:endonuclease V [Amycolatopsis taiwanensis]|uniref:Endonuclease V n=1 Tax=Amycolatopsis taiwanensis TaxID=342230 RepID=A0A9W6VGJ0_9PSEU|nr:endonuclease V [Amycolatopsis taiwanensis]GLY65541.1 endonuclease V [Amycolatopsis taiwanensis]
MNVDEPQTWPASLAEAVDLQLSLRRLVKLGGRIADPVRTVLGLDVTYDDSSSRIAAAAVVLKADDFTILEEYVVTGTVSFPYVPGLFAFRELPPLIEAMRKVSTIPDVVICDGHGVAHVRRFGLACHVGLVTGLPTIGVAKNNFVGVFSDPGPERGSRTPIRHDGEVVGYAVRTRAEVKPVFVSAGHLIEPTTAVMTVLDLSPRYRIPEPVRHADQLSRRALRS